MRSIGLIVLALCLLAGKPVAVVAQEKAPKETVRPDEQREKPKFSPEEFKKRQQEFIIEHAQLTEEETKNVLPLVYEMKEKQREFDRQIGQLHAECEQSKYDEATCAAALKKINNLETQKQHSEKVYQQKILKLVGAAKLMQIMRADSQFDREMLKEMFRQKREGEKQPQTEPRKGGADPKKPGEGKTRR